MDTTIDDIIIRVATANDMHAIVQINDQGFKYPWELPKLRSYNGSTESRFTVLAEHQGMVVGFMCVRIEERDVYLALLVVSLQFRRKGVGRKLLKWLLPLLGVLERETLRLHTFADQSGPRSLYEQLGFRVTKTVADFYQDGGAAVEMIFTKATPPSQSNTSEQTKPTL